MKVELTLQELETRGSQNPLNAPAKLVGVKAGVAGALVENFLHEIPSFALQLVPTW